MEPETIISMLKLRNDFFQRNPGTIGEYRDHRGRRILIAFREWQLKLTREEYETLERFLHWGCGACCGFGGFSEYREGEYIILDGVPCACHTLSWGWSAEIPLE